jgi:tripartite-type tricarboxylate transporter receptor subunit TctC
VTFHQALTHRIRLLHFRPGVNVPQSRILVWLSLAGLMAAAGVVSGQTTPTGAYPNKTIRIVPSEPGGVSDIASRLIAQGISPRLGQPVVVDNRPAIVSIELAAKATPDGYTLLHYGSTIWLLQYMRDHVPWGLEDFAPVAWTTTTPNLVVVHPSLGVNSIGELIALANAKPGQLNCAMGSRASSSHLAAELFISMTGIRVAPIAYKGNVPGLTALMSGEVQMIFPTASSGGPYVKSGKLKALAVTSARPSVLFPGIPTVAASGLPGFESISVVGMLAPAKTPTAIIQRLNQEIVAYLNQADVKQKLANTGSEVVASTPDEFAAVIKSEMARMGKVIKSAGIRAD